MAIDVINLLLDVNTFVTNFLVGDEDFFTAAKSRRPLRRKSGSEHTVARAGAVPKED
jgi:hypothetical protein